MGWVNINEKGGQSVIFISQINGRSIKNFHIIPILINKLTKGNSQILFFG